MIVTSTRLMQLAPTVQRAVADELAGALDTAMPQFGLTEFLPRCHFLAQACHESQGFTRFEENLHYTHPAAIVAEWKFLAPRAADLVGKPEALADAAYAGHNGNGDEASGDGWRYRGRGLFQLTGRANYRAAKIVVGHDLEADPDAAAEPDMAVLTALWFWTANHCSQKALLDDVEAVTRIINGPARAGLSERRALTEEAKQIFT